MLYNGMIHPLVGYRMRGAIWYQGESNHVEGMLYHEKKKALVHGWRKIWGLGDFPFYYVQIAPFQYGNEDPDDPRRVLGGPGRLQQIPNTGMVVTNDIGTVKTFIRRTNRTSACDWRRWPQARLREARMSSRTARDGVDWRCLEIG